MFFWRRETHIKFPFKDCNILKFYDKIALQNSILLQKSFKLYPSQRCDVMNGLDFLKFLYL